MAYLCMTILEVLEAITILQTTFHFSDLQSSWYTMSSTLNSRDLQMILETCFDDTFCLSTSVNCDLDIIVRAIKDAAQARNIPMWLNYEKGISSAYTIDRGGYLKYVLLKRNIYWEEYDVRITDRTYELERFRV